MINKIGCADNYKYKKQISFKGVGKLSVITKPIEETTNPMVQRMRKFIPGAFYKTIERFKKVAIIQSGNEHFSEDLTAFHEVIVLDGVKFDAPLKAKRVHLKHFKDPSLDIHAKEVVAEDVSLHSINAKGQVSLRNVNIDSIVTEGFLGFVGEHNNVREIKANSIYAQKLTSENIETNDIMTSGKCDFGEVQSATGYLSNETKVKKLGFGLGFVADKKGGFSIVNGQNMVVMGDDGMPYGFSAEDLKTPEAMQKKAFEQALKYRRILR